MNALCDIAITNRDPRWPGVMADVERDEDPRERFLCWQRANYFRLAKLFLIDRDCEFEAFSWQQYAKVKGE